MVTIDLQKAFDTVDHGILLDKLKAIGVDSLCWFESYLKDRRQCVEVNNAMSEFLPMTCGVPQGSILGPQLFLLYINDMSISLNCNLSLYADDSALYFAHDDPSVIAKRLSCELANCKKWLIDNKLSLHVGKTESLLFGTKSRLKRVDDFQVFCEGTAVNRVFQVKYLGVLLDCNLSGSLHVGSVLKTCIGRLSFLYRNSSLLDFHCRKTLCMSLIQPYIDYCASSWYEGLSSTLKSRLDVLQRKMVRFVRGFESRQHVGLEHMKGLSWLTIADRVKYFKLVHLFRIKRGLAPHYLRTNLTSVSDAHRYNTRGSTSNYHVSRSLSANHSSFSYSCVKVWNSLPARIKGIDSLFVFRCVLVSL